MSKRKAERLTERLGNSGSFVVSETKAREWLTIQGGAVLCLEQWLTTCVPHPLGALSDSFTGVPRDHQKNANIYIMSHNSIRIAVIK